MTSPNFIAGVARNLAYWQQQVVDDVRIQPRHDNLWRAVDLGARFEQTQLQAADVLIATYGWVDYVRSEQQWLPLVERLAQNAVVKEVDERYTRLLLHWGKLLRLNGQLLEAVARHEQALTVAPDTLLAEIHFHLSEDHRRLHNFKQGILHVEKARALLTDKGDALFAVSTLNTLGLLHLDAGNYVEANQFFRQALTIERELEHPLRIARFLNNLALTASQQGRVEAAFAYYEQALANLSGVDSIADTVMILSNKGALHFAQRQMTEAEYAFDRAENYLRQHNGLTYYKAMTTTNLGKIAQVRENHLVALDYFERSAALYASVGNDIYQANALGAQAEIYTMLEKWESAEKYYFSALKLLQAFPDHAIAQQLHAEFSEAVTANQLNG